MNLIDIQPGQQVIGQLGRNEFPARPVRIQQATDGGWHATLVIQPDIDDVWDTLDVYAATISGPWATPAGRLFTVREEVKTTVTELAEHIAPDQVATPELEARILKALRLDPEQAGGDTLLDEVQAEDAYNEIWAAL